MAYIGHPCACGHGALNHSVACNAPGGCKKRCGRRSSTLLPTFDIAGREIERIVPPGKGLATDGGTSTPTTCTCGTCMALYAELTGTEPTPAAA